MSETRTFHPEATAHEGWDQGGVLALVDADHGWSIVGTVTVSRDEWLQLTEAGADQLFSGQVQEVTWDEADQRVRAVLGRGFQQP